MPAIYLDNAATSFPKPPAVAEAMAELLRTCGANPGQSAPATAAGAQCNVAGLEPVDVAGILDASFGIAVRPGLHCASLAHRSIGTFPRGTVRMSPGCFNTSNDIEAALEAVRRVAASA